MSEYNSIIRARLKELQALVANKQGVFWQRSKIRMALPILPGIGQYIFDLKKESLANGITDFVLKRDDIVVPNGIGVFINIYHMVGNTKVGQLYSFAPKNDGVNPSVFPVGFKTDNIENLYSGNMSWQVGSVMAWENYAMESFKKVFRQEGAFVLDSNDKAVQECIQPEFDIENMMQLVLAKYYVAGTQDHTVTINFPAAGLDFTLCDKDGDTTDYKAELVLYYDVCKLKNGTKLINLESLGASDKNPLVVAAWSAANA